MILTQCAVCATNLGLSLETFMRFRTYHRWKHAADTAARATAGASARNNTGKRAAMTSSARRLSEPVVQNSFMLIRSTRRRHAIMAEACADDTKGQTCYICTARAMKTRASCAGARAADGSGFVHLSCLVRQAKILVEDAEERDLDDHKFERWYECDKCSMCEQEYHGVVRCALGWACWKTHVGAAGGGLGSALGDGAAWNRFIRCKTLR